MKEVHPATKLIVVGETQIPFLLCDEHATAMCDMIAVEYMVHELEEPHEHLCQACHLQEAQSAPRLLLPGEDF